MAGIVTRKGQVCSTD